MTSPLYLLAHYVVPVGCIALTLIFGRWPERLVMLFLLACSVLSAVVTVNTWATLETELAIIDAVVMFVLFGLVFTLQRHWTYWVAALQMWSYQGHIEVMTRGGDIRYFYSVASIYPSIIIFLILALVSVRGRACRTTLGTIN